ncbi:MAG: hypothetical protein ACYTGZ_15770 [Planctomycetota bacterium]|jgi:tetratricopeptide (TPR) repeat protein
MKRAVVLAVALLVAANLIGNKLRAEAPPKPEASRIGVGPLVGGVLTGAFRPMLMNYLYLRADILAGQGRFDEEVTLFKTMVQLYPHNESARAFIGWWLAFNAKGEAQDPALAWRWAEEGLDILVEIPEERSTVGTWFMAQCGQNAFALQRYAGKDWQEELPFRDRARAWGQRRYGQDLHRFDLGIMVLGRAEEFQTQMLQVRLLVAGLRDDWMRLGQSPKLDTALQGLAWAAEVFRELPEMAEAERAEAARLKAIADGSFDPETFPGADARDANALWALGMHQRDLNRLRAALAVFEKQKKDHPFAAEKRSVRAWIDWIEAGENGQRPAMPFDG